MTQKPNSGDQQPRFEQSKSQQAKATIEFFREKFADEDAERTFIDPKGNGASDSRRESQ